MSRLTALASFSFQVRFHTNTPFDLAAEYHGVHLADGSEAWTGWWQRAGERARVELRASGRWQYERDGRAWRKDERGIETRIMDQLSGLVNAPMPEPNEQGSGRLVYRFQPVVPILDPAQTRTLVGRLEVDQRTGLPLHILCRDSLGTAEWEARFGGFNRPVRVSVPFVTAMEFELTPRRRLSRGDADAAVRILRERLAALGWESDVQTVRAGIRVRLGDGQQPGVVARAMGRGAVELWSAERADSATPASDSRVVAVGGDAARRMRLGELLGSNTSLLARVDAAVPMAAGLWVRMPVAAPAEDSRVVLVVDGQAVTDAAVDADSVRFADCGGIEMVQAIAAVAGQGPLPTEFDLAEKWRRE